MGEVSGMNEQNEALSKQLDMFAFVVLALAIICALLLIFLFYVPGASQALEAAQVPHGQRAWLHLHIAAYSLSYLQFASALVLAGVRLIAKAIPRKPWIEGATGFASLLALAGLVFGILASKPMWGAYFVWDIKLILSVIVTIALAAISLASIVTTRISSVGTRNLTLTVLLVLAVLLCTGSFLVGRSFGLTIHPQWFPELLFR